MVSRLPAAPNSTPGWTSRRTASRYRRPSGSAPSVRSRNAVREADLRREKPQGGWSFHLARLTVAPRPEWAEDIWVGPNSPGLGRLAARHSPRRRTPRHRAPDRARAASRKEDCAGARRRRSPPTPPIVFFVAKGEAHACGPGCSEWIAATAPSTPALRPACARCSPERESQAADLLPFAGWLGDRLDGYRPHYAGAEDQGRRRPHHPAGLRPKQRREKAYDAIMRSGRDSRRTAHARDLHVGLRLRPDRRGRAGGRAGRRARRAQRLDHAHVQPHDPRGQGFFASSKQLAGNAPDVHDAHARLVRYASEMGSAPR